ncbi:AraC family transcriptional regulator [Colwellia sp. 12G3]|uniref:AraC family transcriptional regulator n=1 Tax=Colwellia sp. 12G3 TaxID=2058299 RepID=UPI000C3460BF|nr:AraC family transcriptional regulator [Colwellia sp. 12G3]PKI17864.1 AraC family transcriptional regulator [Colwellia sp. 12G3]
MKLGDISVSYLEIIAKTMARLDFDVSDIFTQYLLSPVVIASPDARISIPKLMHIGHACIRLTGIPWLGLEMGRMTAPTNLGMSGLIAISAHDLRQACSAIADYEVLSSFNVRGQSKFYLDQGEGLNDGILEFYSLSPYNEYNYFVVDSVLSGWMYIIASLVGSNSAVKKVCFEFPEPIYSYKYCEFFDCEVLFNQPANKLVINGDWLNRTCLNSCQSVYQLLKRQADSELANVQLGLSFTEKVTRAITPLLNKSIPTLDQVAEQLNVAPWTIRRKLIDEGGSFQKLLNETRRDLAISYMSRTKLSLGEITYLLGFGSPTAFQHAFKRWTGKAPGSYRR